MCGLCGVLGASDHWTEAGAPAADGGRTRRHERLDRVAKLNRVLAPFRLTARDWHGASYLLSSATGRTEVVPDLAHLWVAAERLVGRPCDPLAPDVLAALGRDGP